MRPLRPASLRRMVPALLGVALMAAACGSGGPGGRVATDGTGGRSATAPRAASASTAWTTYHGDLARSGVDQSGAPFNPLGQAWVSPTLDGQVYAQPVFADGLVIVATENDTLYGLHESDGSVAWSTHVTSPVPLSALPCGDIDPLGITGTPAVDPATGRVFAVAETSANGAVSHRLVAVDAASGHLVFQESADPTGSNPIAQQERGALVVTGGRVYIPYGGLDGDCGNFHGWVVGASTAAAGGLIAYQVPTNREGAIWAPPGPAVDGAGDIWVATGNGDSTTTYDHGDSVLKLSPGLQLLDSFAPTDWARDNQNDADLGSTSPQLLSGGLVFQVGKQSTGYLLDANHLGGIGGQLFAADVCATIGGEAYRDPDVYVACSSGIKDVRVAHTSPPSFRVAWSGPSGATGPPVVAGGLVWSVGTSSATLYGLDPASGRAVVQQRLGASPDKFVTPGLGDGLLVVGTGDTVRAFRGPAATTSSYWLSGSDGGVFTYGAARYFGSAANLHLARPVVAMAATPDGGGYWQVGSDGGVFTYGDARFFGSTGNLRLAAPVVGMAPTPDGGGYWMVASDGGVFSFGDARFFGSTGAVRLNRPVTGMAPTPDGRGYWLVATDGGIFSFGDARFFGSTGGRRLVAPVVAMAATPDGAGYWLGASDGGVFTFGDARFAGSAGGQRLVSPVVSMAPDDLTGGYWLAASDGGVFAYGAPFAGSAGNQHLAAPIVAIAGRG
ncbi:MAG TPA: PQQ-binding-like beta-propeller repeat protein [Acidimicrobiales bacterium]|nr:PQQ-binding-like beta-propeller repeat protein [Acidimicrobiales bacterium]